MEPPRRAAKPYGPYSREYLAAAVALKAFANLPNMGIKFLIELISISAWKAASPMLCAHSRALSMLSSVCPVSRSYILPKEPIEKESIPIFPRLMPAMAWDFLVIPMDSACLSIFPCKASMVWVAPAVSAAYISLIRGIRVSICTPRFCRVSMIARIFAFTSVQSWISSSLPRFRTARMEMASCCKSINCSFSCFVSWTTVPLASASFRACAMIFAPFSALSCPLSRS